MSRGTIGLVLRRLRANRWLTLCLLGGVVIATALVSSIPLYTQGVLQRVFLKALEQFQESSGEYPGRYLVQTSLATSAAVEYKTIAAYRDYDERIRSSIAALGIPLVTATHRLSAGFVTASPVRRADGELDRVLGLDSLEGLEEHARFLAGRPAGPERSADGAIEVAVTLGCYERHRLTLGGDYLTPGFRDADGRPLLLRVVGVFTVADSRDPYWFAGIGAYESSAFVALGLFRQAFVDTGVLSNLECEWFFALDYREMTVADLGRVGRALRSQTRVFEEYRVSYRIAALPLISAYFERERSLRLILGLLNAPILVLLAVYMYVVSHFIVENDRNEIAILKSRGATTLQVFQLYVTQSGLLAALALAAGPPLGLLLCSVIGSSSGFMQFVQRRALPVGLSPAGYGYAVAAVAAFMVSTLAPAVAASRSTIVEHKKRRSRSGRAPLWKRLFLDLALLALSAYGYYQFRSRQRVLEVTGWQGVELPLDPALFLVCSAFVMGAALLYLRIFPLAVRAVFRIGRRLWRPATYASLIHVSRSVGRESFLMLFFTAAIALGVFAATSARTINRNLEERIRYALGAEVTVQEDWGQASAALPAAPGSLGAAPVVVANDIREPPFERFQRIEGIDAVSRVFRKSQVSWRSGGVGSSTSLMGIVPHEFGSVAWLRRGLVPEATGSFLREMSERPWLALASRSLEGEHGLKRGDVLELAWSGQAIVQVTILGFFDYWPTFNPSSRDQSARDLVVANLEYLRAQTVPEPYEVWMIPTAGASTQELYDTLAGPDFRVLRVTSAAQEVVRQRNDALLQGTNGALTVGFVITLALCGIGFLLYSVLSFQGRVLQFGVLRAMGVGGLELVGMLVAEQLLTTGSAVLVGLGVGEIASSLFVPLIELVSSASSQVPPFRVASDPLDYLRLLGAVTASVSVGIMALAALLRRLKITQALKLGEE